MQEPLLVSASGRAEAERKLEECRPNGVVHLIPSLPNNVTSDMGFAKMALQKCDERYMRSLVRALPVNVKSNMEFAKLAVQRCGPPNIPALVKALPDEIKSDLEIARLAVRHCDPKYVYWLVREFPDEIKSNLEIAKLAVQKCKGPRSPENIKSNLEFAKLAVERYDLVRIFSLVQILPDNVNSEVEFATLAAQTLSVGNTASIACASLLLQNTNNQRRILEALPHHVHAHVDKELVAGDVHRQTRLAHLACLVILIVGFLQVLASPKLRFTGRGVVKHNDAYSAGIHGSGWLSFFLTPYDPITKAIGMETTGLRYVTNISKISKISPPLVEEPKEDQKQSSIVL